MDDQLKGSEFKGFEISLAAIQMKFKMYFFIFCGLFLIHMALLFISVGVSFSNYERNNLSAYTKAKALSYLRLTSDIKLTYQIDGNEYILTAKGMYNVFNLPAIAMHLL